LLAVTRSSARCGGFLFAEGVVWVANLVAKSEYVLGRERVEDEVGAHIAAWADAIGLTLTDERFPHFREDVKEALHACIRAHVSAPYRWRWSDVRRRYRDLGDDYVTLSGLLRRWETNGRLPPVHFDPRFRELPQLWPDPQLLRAELASFGDSTYFDQLAKVARSYAKACVVDKGGHPPPNAFDKLCVGDKPCSGLIGAFERATGRKATWVGHFFKLVETVWPVANAIARAATKRPLPSNPSTSEARGKRLQRLLKLYRAAATGTEPQRIV
jgi:hypothetical protein